MVQSANGLTDGLAKHEWKEELFLRWLLLCRFLFFCVCVLSIMLICGLVGGWVGPWGGGVVVVGMVGRGGGLYLCIDLLVF